MSDTSDVKLLTLNTKTVFNTSAAIERVKIHNNSSFFLRVYFGADAPTDPSGAGWHDTIDPGGTPLMEVVGNSAQAFSNRSYVQSTPYLGVITIMPFLPVGAQIAAGGIISGASLCYLTGYYPGEWAQEGGEIEAFVQAAKQARYQLAGPGAALRSPFITVYTQATANNTDESLATLTTTLYQNLFAANVVGLSAINIYLFAIWYDLRSKGPAFAGVDLLPTFTVTDAAHAVTRATQGVTAQVMLSATNFGHDWRFWPFPVPMLIQMPITQNTLVSGDILNYRYKFNAVYGTFDLTIGFLYMIDFINQTPLLAVTGLPGTLPLFAWQTYNPQTY